MGVSTHSIEVNAPLKAVYNQWTQFEEFPHFMEGVEEVRQEGNNRLFWRAKIGGKVKEWEAEITEQAPDQRISWESIDGSSNSGTITFESLGADLTRVNATIGYEPEGFLEKTGDALGIPSGRIEEDLQRFRDYVEERGRETGGWRGEIGQGEKSDYGVLPTTSSRLVEEDDRPYAAEHAVSATKVSAQPRETAGERLTSNPKRLAPSAQG
jgi:Polyketide cyclase / dehydrase and lipid transport